ncbi:MAG: TIGR03546 family protein [Treponema sp.]|nr:TIGR03546 family protein [Treponema sp.]
MINAFSSNTDPGAIAHAFACGVVLGFIPKGNLLWILLFVFIFFMRIQRATFSLTIIVAALFAPLLDNLFDSLGYWMLTNESLVPFYRTILDIPFVAFTKINNTMVMGSFVAGLILYIPCYVIGRVFVWLWRKYLADAIRRSKLAKITKQIPLIQKLSSLASKI